MPFFSSHFGFSGRGKFEKRGPTPYLSADYKMWETRKESVEKLTGVQHSTKDQLSILEKPGRLGNE